MVGGWGRTGGVSAFFFVAVLTVYGCGQTEETRDDGVPMDATATMGGHMSQAAGTDAGEGIASGTGGNGEGGTTPGTDPSSDGTVPVNMEPGAPSNDGDDMAPVGGRRDDSQPMDEASSPVAGGSVTSVEPPMVDMSDGEGGAQEAGPPPSVELGTVSEDLVLGPPSDPTHPHLFDVYMPNEAPERAVVFLHGGLGTKREIAKKLGLRPEQFNGAVRQAFIDEMRVAWIIPQGQALDIDGPSGRPLDIATWSNHVMLSGAHDVGFLVALAAWVRGEVAVDTVVLAGHSNGGMMAHRMWCEAGETFERFVGVSGPPSVVYDDEHLAYTEGCVGSRPYWSIVGSRDTVINASLVQDYWTLANANGPPFLRTMENVISARRAHRRLRVPLVCGADEGLDARGEIDQSDDRVDVWSACDGAVRLWWINQPRSARKGHSISDLEGDAGFNLATELATWGE